MGKIVILILVSFTMIGCSTKTKPPRVSGSMTPATNIWVGESKPFEVQRITGVNYIKRFNGYNIPENRKIEYLFYAQNADRIEIYGSFYDVLYHYNNLRKINIPCSRIYAYISEDSTTPNFYQDVSYISGGDYSSLCNYALVKESLNSEVVYIKGNPKKLIYTFVRKKK